MKRFVKKALLAFLKATRLDINYLYGEKFASTRDKEWAGKFCAIIMGKLNPRSVIDFGCGTADLLAPFEKRGVDVLGLDGSSANKRYAKISQDRFLTHDLRNIFKADKRYDLCLCLEVAEHLEEKYSATLVSNLIGVSSTLIFTAAPPGQGGIGHFNEKPHAWWIEKFGKLGYGIDAGLTDFLKAEMGKVPGIQDWYIKNLMCFRQDVAKKESP